MVNGSLPQLEDVIIRPRGFSNREPEHGVRLRGIEDRQKSETAWELNRDGDRLRRALLPWGAAD